MRAAARKQQREKGTSLSNVWKKDRKKIEHRVNNTQKPNERVSKKVRVAAAARRSPQEKNKGGRERGGGKKRRERERAKKRAI